MLFFPLILLLSLLHRVHRGAHILEIRRLFLGWVSSSRKATTSGVGVARSVLKRRRWRTQWWRRTLRQVRRNERTRVVRFIKKGVRSVTGGTKRTPTPERSSTNERSTEISFILHYLFPLFQSHFQLTLSPFPSSTSRTHYLSPSYFRRRTNEHWTNNRSLELWQPPPWTQLTLRIYLRRNCFISR